MKGRAIALLATAWLAAAAPAAPAENGPEPPTFTVYPVHMMGKPFVNVAEVLALLLEKAGAETIEIGPEGFDPKAGETPAAAFSRWLGEHPPQTGVALFVEFVGTPQTGPQAVRIAAADRKGEVQWTETLTPDDALFRKTAPKNPMECCALTMEALRAKYPRLENPYRADAPEGPWAQRWRDKSLLPPEAELEAMEERLAQLSQSLDEASIAVYPARVNRKPCPECAKELADLLESSPGASAKAMETAPDIEIEPSSNEMRVLWQTARGFQKALRENPPEADYALFAQYGFGETTGEAGYVHWILCRRDGAWVAVDMQNSHHVDFTRIVPDNKEKCAKLTAERLAKRLRGAN